MLIRGWINGGVEGEGLVRMVRLSMSLLCTAIHTGVETGIGGWMFLVWCSCVRSVLVVWLYIRDIYIFRDPKQLDEPLQTKYDSA